MDFDLERIREILNMHREEIEKLKKEQEATREKYTALADRLATLAIVPQTKEPSLELRQAKREPAIQLDKFQLLILLKNSKADNQALAVSAQQLKDTFSINKTVRTIHNKMLDLKSTGLIETIGQKPIKYFLTQPGFNLVRQQESLLFK